MAKPDMTKLSALEGFCEWIRKGSGALMVVAIRVDDCAIVADPVLAPRDTVTLLETRMDEIHAKLQQQRVAWQEKEARRRAKARAQA